MASIGIGIGIDLKPNESIGIGIGIGLEPQPSIGIGIGIGLEPKPSIGIGIGIDLSEILVLVLVLRYENRYCRSLVQNNAIIQL